ncbi:OmpA family protein [Limibaculum sp. M0105]|uniref:OmpA family protein n=1 Tax=Thermohalobaculum xanthum TaxID=2753746 RepID=A0A8J7MB84_9RHOB|nr:OmpA family protein [Thermohalobaculum xanthum]MBK0401047.1 OmpA family protein [Thermohalobaculum xanthum]
MWRGWLAPLIALALGMTGPVPAAAQEPVPGQDLASIDPGAPEGAIQTGTRSQPFDRYDLPVGAYGPAGPNALSLEGEVVMRAYRVEDPAATTADTIAGYRERLDALGFMPVFSCRTGECGGFDFRFAVALLPAPAMLIDTADFQQLSMRREAEDGGSVYVSVLASRVLGQVYVQTVTVRPGERALRVTPSPGVEAATDTLILPQDEKSLFDRLMAKGHVPVEGLVFETGGARLSPGSDEALDMLARLLSRNSDIRVAIVGHSDNQGALAANVELSRARADAVMAALAERGVAPDRMEAHGAGWLAPVAANDTEAGRALNRRVELVLR